MTETVSGRSVLVVGLRRSGVAAARALMARGARVTVVERDDDAELRASAAELTGIDVRLGVDPEAAAAVLGEVGASLVVPSPGVSPDNPALRAASATGVEILSEPELAWRLSAGRTSLVAVTGTNGKTSVTTLTAACLGVRSAGNIGTPLIEVLAPVDDSPPALVVAELSSFQLHFASTLRPRVAVLCNVAPDHLDWHDGVDDYRAAKAKIWAAQTPADQVVANLDDPGAVATVAAHPPRAPVTWCTSQEPAGGQVGVLGGRIHQRLDGDGALLDVGELGAPGPHNLSNALLATAAALHAGARADDIRRALREFSPGPHRLEVVADVGGVRYVNDSKATNTHAAAAALRTYDSVVWIAGGLAKGADFSDLAEVLTGRVRAVVTIGTSGPVIAALARSLGLAATEAGTLGEAVRVAAQSARSGDTVLLAPACASMDQFTDYAQRGEVFRAEVGRLRAGAGGGDG